MKRKGVLKKLFCLVIAVAIFAMSIPFTAFAVNDRELKVATISDVHYFAKSSMGNDIEKFIEASKLNNSTSYLVDAVLDCAFATLKKQAEENGLKYVFIPGDLTKNGELVGHQTLAKRLKQFEEETGLQVLVINGNHDINNSNASKFVNGEWVDDISTTPELFRAIYADFGYDLADSFYTPADGEKAGGLSYAATLEGGYRVIALDGGRYSSDVTDDGTDEHETAGSYTPGLMKWAVNEIKKAKAEGLTVIGLTHFNLVPHFEVEESLFEAFVIDDWQRVNETFADAGMHYIFTGHIHTQDVASHVSDNGEVLNDICTTSLLSFPNMFRTVDFKTESNGKITVKYTSHDIDETIPVQADGFTYDMSKPFKYTSYGLNFGEGGIKNFLMGFIESQLTTGFGKDIKDAGGLYEFLVKSVDFDALMKDLTGSQLLGGLSATAVKALLRSLCNQVQTIYLDDVDYTMSVLEPAIDKILNIEVSDYPCTKFKDTYGFQSSGDKGTVGDLASTALAYLYSNDENPDDDKFLESALTRFDNGQNAEVILDTLITTILDDLVSGVILKDIKIDPISLGINGSHPDITRLVADLIQLVTGGDGMLTASLNDLVAVILMIGIVDGNSLSEVVYSFVDEYLTQSQYDIIDAEFYRIVKDLTHDENPSKQADLNGKTVYNGAVKVIPTVDDMRLPSGVAVTFGTDSGTTRNISYYTKYSLTATDIQIVPYSENPNFSKNNVKATVKVKSEEVTRSYSAIDLGFIGIIDHEIPVIRHTVEITGLEAGKKYSYRVGDAARGWWSDAGVIETADNSSKLSFLHVTDPQSVTEKQYKNNWAAAMNTAFKNHDADFILGTGDLVDNGGNFLHWQRFFNTASGSFMNTSMMTATGNHEAKGDDATVDNFYFTNLPEQDTATGAYYSFDYNTAHFAILNTNSLNEDGTLGEEQLTWLKADMANSKKAWKFVALHKAPYSNGAHFDDDDVIALRTQLSTLMPELDIDIVFQGHDHVYLRTDVMSGNQVVKSETQNLKYNGLDYVSKIKPDGTIYSINGTAGVKHYVPKDQSETDALFPTAEKIIDVQIPSYSYIQIDGGNLYFDSYSVEDGKEARIDSFAISKVVTLEDGTVIDGTQNGTTDNLPGDNTDNSNNGNNGNGVNNSGDIPNTSSTQITLIIAAVTAAAAVAGGTVGYVVIKRRREEA